MNAAAYPLPNRGLSLTSLAVPGLIVAILAMMILPLPPLLLDLLFTFNIGLALVVLLVSLTTVAHARLVVFPTILLLTTLLRLSLNVASTRVVLLNGHTGPARRGQGDRGLRPLRHRRQLRRRRSSCSSILVVINFVVITKGAGRIAEVSARFTLDAMPGKQMAIDADLNAGLIDEAEARRRRAEIARKPTSTARWTAPASSCAATRSPASSSSPSTSSAASLIGASSTTCRWRAARPTPCSTIGDGLVAQIPALMVSIAAGLVVSRVGTDADVGTRWWASSSATPRR